VFAPFGMIRNSLADLIGDVGRIKVISTDVFDTLLLRTSRSERSADSEGRAIVFRYARVRIAPDLLVEPRLQAQRLAFRGLALRGVAGEAQSVRRAAGNLRIK